jgi:hypothetical protein
MKSRLLPLFVASLAAVSPALFAQATPTVKQSPPPGIAVPDADAAELKADLDILGKEIEKFRADGDAKHSLRTPLLADVEVFHKAARYAVQYGEFFKPQEIAAAKSQLKLGLERAQGLRSGGTPWISATGPLVLGYTSRIDHSVQPYGLIVPEDWKPGDKTPRPIYLWFHGRGDTLSEVSFIASRLKAKRDFATPNAFELHLYGRWCNASKFAGEVDAFEALADVQRRYSIDPNRIAVMGFSMGGATAWHMGVHHAGLWAVVSTGAGFAETEIYAKVYDEKKTPPPWWEAVLYHLYNATDVAVNYSDVPLLAYSGEIDPQKQSADIMEAAMAREGLKMERFIGPKTAHKYEPETKKELSKRVDEIMAQGRVPMPPRVRFQTYTLRYNTMKWITLDALEQHWEKAEIDAQLVDEGTFQIKTKNVAAITIALPDGPAPLDKTHPPRVVIDGQDLVGPPVKEGWRAGFEKVEGKWQQGRHMAISTGTVGDFPPLNPGRNPGFGPQAKLAKSHGLQGPVDDAFMDSFIFVRPTGTALNEKVGAWAQSEFERAVREWRTVFRGDVRVKDDTALTPEDIANASLVLWGDPGSNKILARVLPSLPVQWTKDKITVGTQSASATDHAPILIYPNPLNPARYVVLNSSFTFRMGARTTNAQQTPKLPDWALIDLRTPPSEQWPGQVVDAGFFDEHWQFRR